MGLRWFLPCIVSLIVVLRLQNPVVAQEEDRCRGPLVQIQVTGYQRGRQQPVYGVFAPFGYQLPLNETLIANLSIASPHDACSSLDRAAKGTVVLVERGSCNFTEKAAHVQQAMAKAMLLYDNQPGCISMGFDDNYSIANLTLPFVSISQESGKKLQALVQSQAGPVQVQLQALDLQGLDASAAVLWLMAVCTVIGGSLWAGHDYMLCRRGGHSQGEVPLLQGPAGASEVVDITAKAAFGFVLLASCMLLLLFFFLNKIFFYVLLVLFCMASIQSMTVTLTALIRLAFPRLAKHTTTVPGVGPCPTVAVLALPPASILVTVWAVMRHAPWSWVLQDLQGICLMLLIFRTLKLSSIKVASLLLSLTFVYDVFWVFIQPLIFGGGKSVMVEVAEGGGTHENLPMLLRVPFLSLPRELGGESMLGFGDVILPGLLVAYTRRVDLDLHLGPVSGYFAPSCVAYGSGLLVTYMALLYSWFGDQGQPALLYLVPCTLGMVLILAYMRGQLLMLWHGSTHRQSKTSQDMDEPAEPAADVEGGSDETELLMARQRSDR